MRTFQVTSVLRSDLLLGAVALASGVLAAWLGARHLQEKAAGLEQQVRERYAPAPFVVASRDVPKGQKIDASLLSIRSMPRAYAPADALSPDQAGQLIGGRAAIGIRRGTPVAPATLVSAPDGEKLSEQLPDGMRALTIQVDQLNALSGHLQAGDLVDLCYSRARGDGAVLVPLLQRVRVLATGGMTEIQMALSSAAEQPGDFSSVTLLVTASDAQRLILAGQTGQITLLLRRPGDEGLVQARSFDSGELLKVSRPAGNQSGRRNQTVELLVGGNGETPARSWLTAGEGA